MTQLLILIIFGFLLIWLFVVLPQRRRQAAHNALIEGLEQGDEVITAGGIYGIVSGVLDDQIEVEVAEGVIVRVAKRAIAAVVPPEEDEEEAEVEGEEDVPLEDSVEKRRR